MPNFSKLVICAPVLFLAPHAAHAQFGPIRTVALSGDQGAFGPGLGPGVSMTGVGIPTVNNAVTCCSALHSAARASA